ncbi:hypothetical protein AXG93_1838s1310 [Marchantia polymorpha subsp. ruderalis]|uniref:mRNA guanylyltransferase n=1 Tax=Marchantia polymorpha subsp. ruderalis TaxID=1480154 RepID=A0A176WGV3_MARPO|nr:hypothetical protein AXG93_1838s1310 [Marchantia polymorpha subsp. ruderalis]
MDLNVAPSTDEDEEEKVESAVDTMRREREERRLMMKRKREEERLEARNSKTTLARIPRHEKSRTAGLNLPEGWLDCPSMGEPCANLFIPTKVPLGERFNEVIPAGKRFSKTHVLRHQRANAREIAMVIDLTNTSRYYQPQEWVKGGVKHVKVPCRGRDEVPEPEAVNQFVYEVINFEHGVNTKQPGVKKYVLCIRTFAQSRPPGIYKQDYIESLYTFYNEKRPEPLICPSTPEWKRPTEVDLNGEAKHDEEDDDDESILAALQEDAIVGPLTMTNDDVLGDGISDEQQMEMQRYICCALETLGKPGQQQQTHSLRFPGSQPVSLDRKNLQLLRQRYYYATWKADGTRYMLFLTRDGCYLIDRNFRFRRVQLRFPTRKSKENYPDYHHLTLLDGEMVIDTVPGSNVPSRRYLVYDLMILNSKSLIVCPFSERWQLIKDEVIDPRSKEKAQKGLIYQYELEKFSVRRKDFWMLTTTEKLLSDFIPKLSHESDGLIFQGWDDLYVCRTHEGLLKWKYARMNSVDFLLQIAPTTGQYLLLLMERGGKFRQLDGAHVTFPDDQDVSLMNGKIIECSWNPEENQWEFMRIRKDKETPNARHVYEKVMSSIQDKITEDVLLEEIREICRLPMYAERIARTHRETLNAERIARTQREMMKKNALLPQKRARGR